MNPSHPQIFYLKPSDGNVEPCLPNLKSHQDPVGQQPPHLYVTKTSPEGLPSVLRDPACFPTRMGHQTPLYFTQNVHEAHINDNHRPESHHTAGQDHLPCLYIRTLPEDRRELHSNHENPRPMVQQHLPCIFLRAGTEIRNPSHTNLPDSQTSSPFRPPLVAMRNSCDDPRNPCHRAEDPQATVQHREQPQTPYFYIRSPTGDHEKPICAAERILAIFPSQPPLVAIQRYPPVQRETLTMGNSQPSPFYLVRPFSQHSSDFDPGSDTGHPLVPQQPSFSPFKANNPQTPRELHRPEGPQNPGQHAQSYIWIKSAPIGQHYLLSNPETCGGTQQTKPSYIWIRNSPRSCSESHMDIKNPQTVTQHQPPIVSIQHSPEDQTEDRSPERRTPMVEPPPSVILMNTPKDPAKAHPSIENRKDTERSLSPLICNTTENKSSSCSESLQLENHPPSVPLKPSLQSLPSKEGVDEHGPAQVLRRTIPKAQCELSSRPQSFHSTQPPLFLLLRSGADVAGSQAAGPGRLPQPHVFIRTVRDCQNETMPTSESFQTVIQGQQPFARQFPEHQRETYCRLERLVQDSSTRGALPNDQSESHMGVRSLHGAGEIQAPGVAIESIASHDLGYYERLLDMEHTHPAWVRIRQPPGNWPTGLQSAPKGNPPPHPLLNTFERESKSFPSAEMQRQSCIFSQATAEFLDRSIPSSGMLPTLVQNHSTLSDGDQRDSQPSLHFKNSTFEEQPPASVCAAGSEKQETGFTDAAGLQTLEQEPSPVPSPESSLANESTSSSIAEGLWTAESPQSCSLSDASPNENNSSPHAQSPDLEENQAPYMLVQSILEDCMSGSASPILRKDRHIQPPSICMTTIPEGLGAADFNPRLRSTKSFEELQTPCVGIRTMAENQSDPSSSFASFEAHPSHVPLRLTSDAQRGTNSDPRHESAKLTPCVFRSYAGDHSVSCPGSARFQACGHQQPPTNYVKTFPEDFRVSNSSPYHPLHPERHHRPNVLIRSSPEDRSTSFPGFTRFQACGYEQPPAAAGKYCPEDLWATGSAPKWPQATACQKSPSFFVQIIPEDQNKCAPSPERRPATDFHKAASKAHNPSSFVFFRVVSESERGTVHRFPSPQPHQTVPDARSGPSPSRRLRPLRFSHSPHHASRMRPIMPLYNSARRFLGAIPEDEGEACQSPSRGLALNDMQTPLVPGCVPAHPGEHQRRVSPAE